MKPEICILLILALAGPTLTAVLSQNSKSQSPIEPDKVVKELDKELIHLAAESLRVKQKLQEDLALRFEMVKSKLNPRRKAARGKRLLMSFLRRHDKKAFRKLENLDLDKPGNFFEKYWPELVASAGLLGVGAMNGMVQWGQDIDTRNEVNERTAHLQKILNEKKNEYDAKMIKLNKDAKLLGTEFEGFTSGLKNKEILKFF